MAYVYRHIRLDKNEPFYIGVGSAKNHYRAYGKDNRNKHWHNIVKNTDYEVEILFDNLDDQTARLKEIEFIKLYGRVDLKTGTLVNLTDGGDGCLSRKMTEEIKQKIALSNTGKKIPDEIRKKMSEVHKKRLMDPEQYRKHCESSKNNVIKVRYVTPTKAVLQYDSNNNLLREFSSLTEASDYLGGNKTGGISRCCNNYLKTAFGYIWKFKTNN